MSCRSFVLPSGASINRRFRIIPPVIAVPLLLLSVLGGVQAGAETHVRRTGSYTTSVSIPVPAAPGAPTITLEYNSAAGLGLAGVGWDVSMGWPMLIARDTRFGTPPWDFNSPWLWGGAPLVSSSPGGCTGQSWPCKYRSSPDSLASIEIDLQPSSPGARAITVGGEELTYEAVRYNAGASNPKYPQAPPGQTNVFSFLLKSVRSPNGYLTCFKNRHWGDDTWGRVAVVEEITYGAAIQSCDSLPSPNAYHRIVFEYVDATDPTATGGSRYFMPVSYRLGAPASFNNLLKSIILFAQGVRQGSYQLDHEAASFTETRLPRLEKISEEVTPGGDSGLAKTRTLRRFRYGNRNPVYGSPQLIDVGADASEFPTSLSGSSSRPVRHLNPIDNTYGIFQTGKDQIDTVAPPSHAVTRQWGLADLNGDGLQDTIISDERGVNRSWPTFEDLLGGADFTQRPAQQWAYINNGVVNGAQKSTKVVLNTHASTLETGPYNPDNPASVSTNLEVKSRWIWPEGLGRSRTGMPMSVSSPELRGSEGCPPSVQGLPSSQLQDFRRWPYHPDGSIAGSKGSVGELIHDSLAPRFGSSYQLFSSLKDTISQAFTPKHSVSAALSGWLDWDGDGVRDWVVSPGLIARFGLRADCAPGQLKPHIPELPADHQWYVARGRADLGSANQVDLDAVPERGPHAPTPLPLSFSTDASQAKDFGLKIPVGSLITAAVSTALNGGTPNPADVASILAEAVTPSGSAGLFLTKPSPSASAGLLQLAMADSGKVSSGDAASAAGHFLMSAIGVSLDLVLAEGGNLGRSENRAELMDVNADGRPDYVMHDSAGISDPTYTGQRGDIIVFLNDGNGGFSGPQPVNRGYSTNYHDPGGVVQTVADAVRKAELALGVDLTPEFVISARALDGSCQIVPTPYNCLAVSAQVVAVAAALLEAADAAEPFLNASRDALPGDRGHVTDARKVSAAVITSATFNATASVGASAPPGIPVAKAASTSALQAAEDAVRLAKLIELTVRQLAFPSKLNLLSKAKSHLDGAFVGNAVSGASVQTQGLIDLNGDALPDYVITDDALKTCADNEWEVYWGTGTSTLSQGRGFTDKHACLRVPAVPSDLAALKPAYRTFPIGADFILQRDNKSDALAYAALAVVHPAFILVPVVMQAQNKEAFSRMDTFVSLLDYNQDGLPDLIVANSTGKWDPNATSNVWLVYLNNGRGFESTPLPVVSPSGTAAGLSTFHEPFPGRKSAHTREPIIGLRRSESSVDLSFVDVDGDGTADLARRVLYGEYQDTGGNKKHRSGILYWSRGGTDPQDLLVEDRDTLNGSRINVSYLPAPYFQWDRGTPSGAPPPRGHRLAIGTPAYLVRSVRTEPFLGRSMRRTEVAYDYKDPHFDSQTRSFTGFGEVTEAPVDPAAGTIARNSTSSLTRSSQVDHARSAVSHVREVDSSSGAVLREQLASYAQVLTATGGPGPMNAYWTGAADTIDTEFPEGLTVPPVLDLGLDGREPLKDRASHQLTAVTFGNPAFWAEAPTGGAMRLDGSSWLELTPSSSLRPQSLTIEAWIAADAPGTVVGAGGYELKVDGARNVIFGVNVGGAMTPQLTAGLIEWGQWTHIVASYDGAELRAFVNAVSKGSVNRPGAIAYPPAAADTVRIGCSAANSGCLRGSIGELRIYPEAWTSPPRITRLRTEYESSTSSPIFGLPVRVWNYGDIATGDDDFYEELSYAKPVGSNVRTAVATRARKVLYPDGSLGGYLGYSEVNYDGLPLGQVARGNPTQTAAYSGVLGAPVKPSADLVTKTIYGLTACPGVATATIDPEGYQTRFAYDSSCAFQTQVTNALGHTARTQYFGVDGVQYRDSTNGFTGYYGQTKAVTDANGATTLTNYDEWGRVIASVGPYEHHTRPGAKVSYRDAQCEKGVVPTAMVVGCDDPAASRLGSPSRVTRFVWDDMLNRYAQTHTFADGQVQTEAVSDGNLTWLVSGTQDHDALGRVSTTYKPRYLPMDAPQAATDPEPCPPAGTWCDSEPLPPGAARPHPLRVAAQVAHVQTAYDRRGRLIRVYGPEVEACADPSAVDAAGQLMCDQKATPAGNFTRLQYSSPGTTRTLNAHGVPTVVRRNARGAVATVEEYIKSAPQNPYAKVDYSHDRNGNLERITDHKGNAGSRTYDAVARLLSSNDPDMGKRTFTYDRRGLLLTQEDAAGALTKHGYDELGRLERTEYWSPVVTPVCLQPTKTSTPHLELRRELFYDVNKFELPQCSWVCPACKPEPGPYLCSGPQPSAENLWRRVPQFSNQSGFSPVDLKWRDLRLSPLPIVAGDRDNGLASLPLPFDFVVRGVDIVALREKRVPAVAIEPEARWRAGHRLLISTNGRIRFDSGAAMRDEAARADNGRLPAGSETALYPFWDDLVMTDGMSYAVIGRRPQRQLIIQWDGAYRVNPRARVLFRAVLSEGTNEIEYQYRKLALGSLSATIGLQYRQAGSREVQSVEFGPKDGTVSEGMALSSLRRKTTDDALQFSDGTTYRIGRRAAGYFVFAADLTNSRQAELRFDHRWDTRCVDYPEGKCPVDDMKILGFAEGMRAPVPLLSTLELASRDSYRASTGRAVTVRLPNALLGHKVALLFSFDTIDGGPIGAHAGWVVNNIQVVTSQFACPPPDRKLEEVVERHWDSAEPSFAYEGAKPVLDLTFDVPGVVSDRSPEKHTIPPVSLVPVAGVSGTGIRIGPGGGGPPLAIPPKPQLQQFGQALTVEAWVNAEGVSTMPLQTVVAKGGTFALGRDSSGEKLHCFAFAGGGWQEAVSVGIVPAQTWVHVAMTYDGAAIRCYINGNEDGSVVVPAGSGLGWTNAPFYAGRDESGNDFRGLLDEVRVFAGVRSAAEIRSDAELPHRGGPPRGNVLDLRFASRASPGADRSGVGNDASSVQAALVPGLLGDSASFDGDPGQFVAVPHRPSLASNDVTAEVWLRTTDIGDRLLVGKWDKAGPGWRLALDDLPGRVRFEVRTLSGSGSITATNFITLEQVADDRWHHVAGVYDGRSLRVYIDGRRAHRLCKDPETGAVITCTDLPGPECRPESEVLDNQRYQTSVCVSGSILNTVPVYAGNYDPSVFPKHPSLRGMEDEIRLSNYPKRDFEMAASAREYRAYTLNLGRQTEIRSAATRDHAVHDLLGRVVTVQRNTTTNMASGHVRTGEFLIRNALDSQGRTAAVRYPDGEVVVSDYDRAGTEIRVTGYGNLAGFGGSFGKQSYLSEKHLTSSGLVSKLVFGNGVSTELRYSDGPTRNPATGAPNNNGTFGKELLSDLTTTLPGGSTLQRQHYEYDLVGNLLKRADFSPLPPNPPSSHQAPLESTFTYDDLNRLMTFNARFGSTALPPRSYDYDDLGNLTAKEGATLAYGAAFHNCGASPVSTLPHAVTRVTDSAGVATHYCYDPNGSLVGTRAANQTMTLARDARGKLRSVATASSGSRFAYDGDGDRLSKEEPDRLTIEPFRFYREMFTGAGDGKEKYYFSGGRRIARRIGLASNEVFWYHPEHLGGTNVMTGAAGTELQDAYSEYMPFGQPLATAPNNTAANQYQNQDTPNTAMDRSGGFQFTGKESDDSGFYYFGARYYSPIIGRFVEADSLDTGQEPQALNRYSYVLNNPLVFIDPNGHAAVGAQNGVKVSCRHCTLLGMPEELPALPPALTAPEAMRRLAVATFEEWRRHPEQELRARLWERPYAGPTLSAREPDSPNRGIPGIKLLESAISGPLITATAAYLTTPVIGLSLLPGLKIAEGGVALSEGNYDEARRAFAAAAMDSLLNSQSLRLAPPKPAGHVLDVTIIRNGSSIHFSEVSGEVYSFFGHTEVQFAQKFWRTLKPGDLVLLQGSYNVCPWGLCHASLDAAARITGADILYYSYEARATTLRSYWGGRGFVRQADQ